MFILCTVRGLVIDVHLVVSCPQVECKKAQPKEVMFPPGTRGRARGLPYTMDAFMLGMGMLSEYGPTLLQHSPAHYSVPHGNALPNTHSPTAVL